MLIDRYQKMRSDTELSADAISCCHHGIAAHHCLFLHHRCLQPLISDFMQLAGNRTTESNVMSASSLLSSPPLLQPLQLRLSNDALRHTNDTLNPTALVVHRCLISLPVSLLAAKPSAELPLKCHYNVICLFSSCFLFLHKCLRLPTSSYSV